MLGVAPALDVRALGLALGLDLRDNLLDHLGLLLRLDLLQNLKTTTVTGQSQVSAADSFNSRRLNSGRVD